MVARLRRNCAEKLSISFSFDAKSTQTLLSSCSSSLLFEHSNSSRLLKQHLIKTSPPSVDLHLLWDCWRLLLSQKRTLQGDASAAGCGSCIAGCGFATTIPIIHCHTPSKLPSARVQALGTRVPLLLHNTFTLEHAWLVLQESSHPPFTKSFPACSPLLVEVVALPP